MTQQPRTPTTRTGQMLVDGDYFDSAGVRVDLGAPVLAIEAEARAGFAARLVEKVAAVPLPEYWRGDWRGIGFREALSRAADLIEKEAPR